MYMYMYHLTLVSRVLRGATTHTSQWDQRDYDGVMQVAGSFRKYTLLLYKLFRMAIHSKVSTLIQLALPPFAMFLGVMMATDSFDVQIEDDDIKTFWVPADRWWILFSFFYICEYFTVNMTVFKRLSGVLIIIHQLEY